MNYKELQEWALAKTYKNNILFIEKVFTPINVLNKNKLNHFSLE